MLVLSRQRDETVVVIMPDGTRVEVVTVDVRSSDKVRLGFIAPDSVRIIRKELTPWREAAEARRE